MEPNELCKKFRLDAAGDAHLDAAQTVFFARQLEEIDAQVYDVKYAKLEAFELLPVKTLHPGVESYTYRQFDGAAVAKMTSDYSSGSPRADVKGLEFTSRVRGIRNSYGYSVQEIRAAQRENLPLENMRAAVARRGINEAINKRALMGDSEHGIYGLFALPNAAKYTVPKNAGNTSSYAWADKTAAEILNDMFGIVDSIPTATKEVEHAKRLLLPYAELRRISRMKIDSVSPITVLQFFQDNRPGIEVRGALYLDTAATENVVGGGMMVAYDPDRTVVELLLPVAFESFPPERKGLEWVVENHARMGSVVNRYPLAVCYGHGISAVPT